MSRIEEVKRLKGLEAKDRYDRVEYGEIYKCNIRDEGHWLLDVAGKFQTGDGERLQYAARYLETTNCPEQCIDAVRRLVEAAAIMEEE